ncbi:helix-turn-helix domain-containing protein [Sphingomonas sp. QA11]|uniref:helix-turn-helix domain-containing protein n=1 Tax=Sphingomonas sp. QA11 TaxID=2950605 RepID=UPI00234ABDE8|nr:helix-turn-helix transcriptional regulator [Sphingomonas sp. QA11]WCM25926.1 helix-turn-helix domain-containing protein [Sphingomonas sp. QA11]
MDVVRLFGKNVRYYREIRDLSQEELALSAGVERSYISDIERGTRNPTVRILGRLAEALEVEPAVLLETSHRAENR